MHLEFKIYLFIYLFLFLPNCPLEMYWSVLHSVWGPSSTRFVHSFSVWLVVYNYNIGLLMRENTFSLVKYILNFIYGKFCHALIFIFIFSCKWIYFSPLWCLVSPTPNLNPSYNKGMKILFKNFLLSYSLNLNTLMKLESCVCMCVCVT